MNYVSILLFLLVAMDKQSSVVCDPHIPQGAFVLKIFVGKTFLTSKALKDIVRAYIQREGNWEFDPTSLAGIGGCVRIGKSPKSPFAFFNFQCEDSLEKGSEMLQHIVIRGIKWKRVELEEKDFEFFDRGLTMCRKRTHDKDEASLHNAGVDPWKYISYPEQIEKKKDHCISILREIGNGVNKQLNTASSMYCDFQEVIPSVKINGYRNRVDLCVGCRKSGEESTSKPYLGFNAGSFKEGFVHILPFESCMITPHIVIELANIIQDWIQAWWQMFPEDLCSYDKETHNGFWRRVSMRITSHGAFMVIMQTRSKQWFSCNLKKCSASHFNDLQKNFVDSFHPYCASIQWQEFDGCSNAAPHDLPFTVLSGRESLVDYVCGLPFHISAGSFFQVNTPSMEKLIERVKSFQCFNSKTILLDICCGTGLIGLCLHSSVAHVIGIEVVRKSIEDAERNAHLMGVENVDYICAKVEESCSKIEECIRNVVKNSGINMTIVAAIDPPRCGLHKNIIQWLRRSSHIKSLIYVSCNQRALVADCVHLSKSPTIAYPGKPFTGVTSFAVDFFPHTAHVEQVVLLHRA